MGFIKRSLRMAFTLTMVATLVAMTAGVASAAGPKAKASYNSVPTNVPGNMPSQPFQAQQTSEFGDSVALAGSLRKADSVDVVMSSWGCQTGTWNAGDCATKQGRDLLSPDHAEPLRGRCDHGRAGRRAPDHRRKTFAIPFRPSADAVKCTAARAGGTARPTRSATAASLPKISFDLDGTVLPTNVIWTVAFNTSGYGASPMGYTTACAVSAAGCGYDSLNVGVQSFVGQPSAGTDVDPAGVVLSSTTPGVYCDGGAGGAGTLRLDTGCWTGFTPLATIRTKQPLAPPAPAPREPARIRVGSPDSDASHHGSSHARWVFIPGTSDSVAIRLPMGSAVAGGPSAQAVCDRTDSDPPGSPFASSSPSPQPLMAA